MGGGDRDVRRRRAERDERHDVDHAEPRVDPDVFAEIEVFDGDGRESASGGLGTSSFGGGEGEDAAVVVEVAVDIEQRRAGRGADRRDSALVSALRDVDDCFQHGARLEVTAVRLFGPRAATARS